MSKSWASTLRLPKSTFPPRPLPHLRENYIRRCADSFYQWQASNRPAADPFVIHDGPPYANGSLHVGHALNKILKDIILRVKVQQGRRVIYVPGWDCHGLPIELKAVGASAGQTMTPVEIRRSARELASRTVLSQMTAFRSYAVMGDWDRRWTTMDPAYEIRQLRLFQQMLGRGLVYRRYKPVYWSPSSRTALAEAELEYNENHVSKAAYVKLPITNGQDSIPELRGVSQPFLVVWTTTPWTLPANEAIAVHDGLAYSVVEVGGDVLVIASSRLDAVLQECFPGSTSKVMAQDVDGRGLKQLMYKNPLRGDKASAQPVIHADFVSADSGSGLVHCAPGHGFEDYEVCTPLGIAVSAPVDDNGCFTDQAYPADPRRLESLPVGESGSMAVLDILGNHVLGAGVRNYRHKYPYDWRTKQPVIVRATAQWFADVAGIKGQALRALDDVRFIPESGRNRLEAFVKGRSEWCISRQRAWGVPIPALYDANGDAVMTVETVEHVISVIEERGADAWWSDAPDDPAWVPRSLHGKGEYRRGNETMDVWFDSGSSWTQNDGRADVYLEGSDQHRGWFQSSLLTRVAARATEADSLLSQPLGLAPFRTLITHGFTLDQEGKKMSKSVGNIISPDQVMDGTLLPPVKAKKKSANAAVTFDALGPDALRLWASSSDYTKDIVIGEPVLKAIHVALIKYRTVIKMLLGSMHESARTAPLTALDHVALIQLRDVMDEVGQSYDSYEFHKAFTALNRWVNSDLSAFYLEALKDRLYCADGGGVLEPMFHGLLRVLAPVAPVLVEEAWYHRPAWMVKDDDAAAAGAAPPWAAIHPLHQLYAAPLIDTARVTRDESALRAAIPALMAAHAAIKFASETARTRGVLGSSLECAVRLTVPDAETAAVLDVCRDELDAIFVVSSVSVDVGPVRPAPPEGEHHGQGNWSFVETFTVGAKECSAVVLPPQGAKCPRCWRYVAPREDQLCGRCEDVVASM